MASCTNRVKLAKYRETDGADVAYVHKLAVAETGRPGGGDGLAGRRHIKVMD